jgi:hypothetical protein
LIALPLFKPTFEKVNSCFVNPESFVPIADQWNFLKNIQKVTTDHLDKLYNELKSGVEFNHPLRCCPYNPCRKKVWLTYMVYF